MAFKMIEKNAMYLHTCTCTCSMDNLYVRLPGDERNVDYNTIHV